MVGDASRMGSPCLTQISADRYLPTLESYLKTAKGERGWTCTFYQVDDKGIFTEPVAEFILEDTRVKLNDFIPNGLGDEWGIKLQGYLTVDHDMPFEFGLAVSGKINYLFQTLSGTE